MLGDILAKPKERKSKLLGITSSAYEQYKRDLPRYQTAKELMSKEVITVSPEMRLDEAAKIMGEKRIGSLIVMKNKKPVGIVTERDLLSKVLAMGLFLGDKKVRDVMLPPLASISSTTKIKEVAQMMINGGTKLGVVDGETLVGVITVSNLIKTLPDTPETADLVDDFMSKTVVLADEEMPLRAIVDMLGRNRIGSVIIARNGEPFGIFTEGDLLTGFLASGRTLSVKVGPVCSSPLIAIPTGTSIHRAAATMALKQIRHLPVVRGDEVVGMITARDFLKVYAK